MSRFLSDAAQTLFDNAVKHEYQTMGSLRRKVTNRTGVVGDTYKFRKMGRGLATKKVAPSQQVVPMDVTHTLQTATLENWVAPEYTDIFDQAEVNFSERQELAYTIAAGLSRREDQIVIDAMDGAGAYAGTITEDIGGTGTDLNPAKLRRAARLLNDNGVPMSGRVMLHGAFQLEALLANTEVTSTDFNSVKALVNGEVNTFMGFEFHMIDDRSAYEGGLSVTGDVRDCYAFHRDAIGYASAMEPRARADWVADRTSWLSIGMLKAGAVVRDTDGVVKVQCDEA